MAHRRVDVDDIIGDEDAFIEDAITASVEELNSLAVSRTENAKQAISRGFANNNTGDFTSGLKSLFQEPPVAGIDPSLQGAKDLVVSCAIQILSTARTQDIPAIVSSLSIVEQDQLLKYIYRGFQNPQVYNSAVLLAWHEKVVEIAGVGCITRCLTDRRTV